MDDSTFLSPSVRTLLHCSSFTVVQTDHSSEFSTDNATFNWENIGVLLKDSSENPEPQELALRSKKWFVDTIRTLVPVFDTAERLCQNAATRNGSALCCLYGFWEWTGSAEELSKCLQDSFGRVPNRTSAVESMLVTSAILERALGNVLRQKDVPVPFLLRDLLLEKPLYDTFGKTPMQFTRLFVGMPSALNARNLGWHGFVAPNEMTLRIPATLLILLASLGKVLQCGEIPFSKNKSIIAGTDELPDLTPLTTIDEWRSVLMNSTIIPPQFLPYWEDALERYKEQQFGRCLVLLLPQLELVLRIGFCVSNDCPKRLLTAVQSAPHTTLDDMLVETTDGRPNNLCKELGEGLLNALFDLLQRPSGPRIRDRLGHGECSLDDISHNLATVLVSLSISVATRLSKDKFSGSPFWDSYTARFHPTVLFFKTGHDVLDRVEKLLDAMSTIVPPDEGNLNIVASLETALTDGDPTETARREAKTSSLATLFRPRQEIIATVAMLRALRCLCVALEATRAELVKRSSDKAEGQLRSRQRKTLQRMFQIIPSLTKTANCLVIMAVRIRNTVANNRDDFAHWQRCIIQMEKYTEKLSSYVHGTKNRWEEVKLLTSNFCDKVLPFFS